MLFVTAHQPSVVDTNAMCALPPALYKPHHYSKNVAVGGCDEAVINAYGSRAALDALRGCLGFGVRIINDEGTVCWWGFIENVNVAPEAGSAEIACKGWGHKFKNRYYAQSAGMDAYMDGAGAKHNVSEGSGITKLAQSFRNTTGVNWTARRLALNLYVVGTRADNVNVDIVADNAGSPSTTVISSWATSPSGAVVATANGTMLYDLTTPFTYDSTLRWIVVTPTGTLPIASGMYQVGVNDKADYANGSFKYYIPTTWTANRADNGKATDIQFKLIGAETIDTILSAIYAATVANDYFAGIDFASASYPSTCQYRDGKERADKVVEAILKIGNGSNQRLLFAVSEQRRIRVYPEPYVPAAPYSLVGAVKIGQDLSKIVNEVRAIYTTQNGASSSGSPATTAWSTDNVSVTRYGKRQLTLSLNNIDAAAAATAVATALSQRAYPATQFDFGSGGSVDIYGPGGGRIRRDACPYGYWARLSNANVGTFDSPFARGANLCFIDGAEYNAEQDDYMPIPKGQVDPLKARGIEYSEA